MKKVRIHSDGFGGDGTVIIDEDGNTLDGVREVSIRIEAGEFNEATIELSNVTVNIEAAITEVTIFCPACSNLILHKCDDPDTQRIVPGQAATQYLSGGLVIQPGQTYVADNNGNLVASSISLTTPAQTYTFPAASVPLPNPLPNPVTRKPTQRCKLLVGASSVRCAREEGHLGECRTSP